MGETLGLTPEGALTLGALALLLIAAIVVLGKGVLWTSGSVARLEKQYEKQIADLEKHHAAQLADRDRTIAEKQEIVDLYRSSEDVKQKILADLAEGAKSSRAANETLMHFIQALDRQRDGGP